MRMAETTHSAPGMQARPDWLTIGAMAAVAYLIAVVTHEALGHGVAALLVGAPVQHVTSLDLATDLSHVGPWQARFVAAAGCLAQFLLASVLWLLRRRWMQASADTHYFCWLLLYINVFIPAGYLMVLSFAPFGDWNDFVQGLPQPVLWRAALTALGLALTLLALFAAARDLAPFLPAEPRARRRRGIALALVPYLVGGAVNTLAGIFNPDSPLLVLTSAAAASFGGTICLFWAGFTAGMSTPNTPTVRRQRMSQHGDAELAVGRPGGARCSSISSSSVRGSRAADPCASPGTRSLLTKTVMTTQANTGRRTNSDL